MPPGSAITTARRRSSTSSRPQFWLSLSDARWFAAAEIVFDPKRSKVPRYIVGSFVCKSTLQLGYEFSDAGHPAISFGVESLPAINRDAADTGGIKTLQAIPPI
jgi:hypothetical protein